MSLVKYAFIMNSQTLTPDFYTGTTQSDSFLASFYAVNSFEMAKKTAAKLANEGYAFIDLCGDYDEAAANAIQKFAGEKTEVAYMKYFPEEMEKMQELESLFDYGIIIIHESFNPEVNHLLLKSDEFMTHIVAVSNLEQACQAAQKFKTEGIDFIELCSDFTAEMAKKIIESVDGQIPVGFAGAM